MTTTSSPREILARLISLRNNAGTNLFLRLKLANQLLSDREWVEDPSGGGGDASRALDRIEEDCFGPEAGMSLPEMLEVLAAVPQEKVWKQNRYNLKKMWLEMKECQEAGRRSAAPVPEKKPSPSPTPAMQADPVLEQASLEEENRKLREELKAANHKLKEQDKVIRKLKGSVQKMKTILKNLQEV